MEGDERDFLRQQDRDEREQRQRREDEDRRARQDQLQMALMMKMFGDSANKKKPSTHVSNLK